MENIYKNKNTHKNEIIQILMYSIGFIIYVYIIKYGLDKGEVTAIYSADALVQHYPSQHYLQRLFYDILHLKTSPFNEINYSVGLGQDILSTYHYYGLNDPLSMFTGIKKIYNQPKLYMFLLFFRMYLSGMAFLVMSNRFKKDRKIGVVGAYVYIFSGYCLTVGFMHPYFINAMILLPLLIVSLDKLMTDEKCMSRSEEHTSELQ